MNKLFKIVLFAAAVVLIVFLIAGRYFCPLFNPLPVPTGRYAVGEVFDYWINNKEHLKLSKKSHSYGFDRLTTSARPELVEGNERFQKKYNEFNVDIFYPSNNTKTLTTFAYQPNKINALKYIKAQNSYVPHFMWQCLLSNMYTYAEPQAPFANEQSNYPVILYLPGIGGDDLHNIYLEELASHGYIVVAIEPPYDISVTVFPHKERITIDPDLKNAIEQNNRDAIYAYRNQAHERWTRYIEFALEQLKQLNQNKESIFYQKLDLNRIGLIGHSHGGAVVTDFCQKNSICKAGVNMDGWTKTYNTGQSFATPFLFLLSESGEMPEMQDLFRNNHRADFKKVIMQGAGHGGFNDHVLIKQPLARWFGQVTGNAQTVIHEIKSTLVTFFDAYLR